MLRFVTVSGPLVAVHDQTIPLPRTMARITERNTKAEILQAYQELLALQSQGASWQQIQDKVTAVSTNSWREFQDLIVATYNAGASLRRFLSFVVDELNQPVLRSNR